MKNNSFNVIIDSNVLISSLISKHSDSATAQLMNLFYNDKINLYYSEEILIEYVNVLNRPKFKFNIEMINTVITYIIENGIKITPENKDIIMIDIKDKPFYELVMDEQVDNAKLITGNIKHFPIQTNIITPSQFMEMYNKNLND